MTSEPVPSTSVGPASAAAATPSSSSAMPAPRRAADPSTRRIGTIASMAFLALLLFMVAGVAGLALYGARHGSTVYQGVWAGSVDLSGMTEQEASAAIEGLWTTYRDQPITIQAREQQFAVTPLGAGLAIDTESTVANAMDYGRDGSFWQRSQAWMTALMSGVTVPVVMAVDPEESALAFDQLASQVERDPISASVQIDSNGMPQVVSEVDGIDVDQTASLDRLLDVTAMMAAGPIDLAMTIEPPSVAASTVADALPAVVAATGRPLTVTAGEASWTLETADLRDMLSVDEATNRVVADPEKLTAFLTTIDDAVSQPVTNAGVIVNDMGRLEATPSAVGRARSISRPRCRWCSRRSPMARAR